MKAALQARARELGFDLCRVTAAAPPASAHHFLAWLDQGCHGGMAYLARNASRRVDPAAVLPGARSVVCLAVSYHAPDPPPAPRGSGQIARYARYTDYHEVLLPRVNALAALLEEHGGPGVQARGYVDTGPVLERDLAQRAGLGFIGRHTNLVSRELGNWFFLAEVLTTARLEPDAPEPNRCGRCTRCLDACPTGAIREPFLLDARRCLSYLTIELKGAIPVELRPALGTRIFGCDDCLEVCPWNRFARASRLLESHARPALATPDLLDLLSLDEPAFRTRFAGTPMLRPRRRGLLRNVCVALGNRGDPDAIPALERAATDPEPLIAEHARWALDQLHPARLPA